MLKYTILTVALVVSHFALFATESFVYREGSSDKFFVEQTRNISNGNLQEKIAAIGIFGKIAFAQSLNTAMDLIQRPAERGLQATIDPQQGEQHE